MTDSNKAPHPIRRILIIGFVIFVAYSIWSVSLTLEKVSNLPSPTPSSTPNPEQVAQEKAQRVSRYCSTRKESYRAYLIPTKPEAKEVQGRKLTNADCQTVIDYLYISTFFDNIDDIIDQNYWIGMHKLELMMTVGAPDDINSSNYGSGVQQQWIYRKDDGVSAYYMYLRDDVVTSYQDF